MKKPLIFTFNLNIIMFFFRINKLKIFDNREKRKFLGIIGKDVAQVKLVSFVSTSIDNDLPDLTDFIAENDDAKKKEILKAAIQTVVSKRILTEIENVKDNSELTFGDTGFVLFQSKEIPEFFDWQFIAYESDKNVRTTAQMIQDALNDSTFDTFTKNLTTILSIATSPVTAPAVEIAKFVALTITNIAKKNKDDMIGILLMSLNKREHYPHGERKKDDVPDLTNNMLIDYSIFGFDEVG